jgi:hypothetical protein
MNGYDKGYIALYRKFKNWRYYKNDNIKSVFIHCLLSAYWKDEVITEYRGKTIDPPIVIPKGSFITSRRKFATDLEKTEGEIRQAWSKLSSDDEQPTNTTHKVTHEIELITTQLYTIVKVNNFNEFQGFVKSLQPSDLEELHPQLHPQVQPQLNNNILNKDKKDIKDIKDKSTDVHFRNLNSLTVKLLKSGYIDESEVPETYDLLFEEYLENYDYSHLNVIVDYILKRANPNRIKNKYSYLKKSINSNLRKLESLKERQDDEKYQTVFTETDQEKLNHLLEELQNGNL